MAQSRARAETTENTSGKTKVWTRATSNEHDHHGRATVPLVKLRWANCVNAFDIRTQIKVLAGGKWGVQLRFCGFNGIARIGAIIFNNALSVIRLSEGNLGFAIDLCQGNG